MCICMSGLPWYKCDPVAFNNGMVGLTLSQRGVYATVINCIYAKGAPVKDDALYFSALLACDRKEWIAARKVLIALGRLSLAVVDGVPCLSDSRAEAEIGAYQAWIAKKRRGGLASVKARGIKSRNHLKLVDD